jgi:hypothetical protein
VALHIEHQGMPRAAPLAPRERGVIKECKLARRSLEGLRRSLASTITLITRAMRACEYRIEDTECQKLKT